MKQRHKHISTTALSKNPSVSVMGSWIHNNASDLNDIGREYNHREHRGTQRIDLKTLCPLWLNPVAFTACMGSIRPQQNPSVFTGVFDGVLNYKEQIGMFLPGICGKVM